MAHNRKITSKRTHPVKAGDDHRIKFTKRHGLQPLLVLREEKTFSGQNHLGRNLPGRRITRNVCKMAVTLFTLGLLLRKVLGLLLDRRLCTSLKRALPFSDQRTRRLLSHLKINGTLIIRSVDSLGYRTWRPNRIGRSIWLALGRTLFADLTRHISFLVLSLDLAHNGPHG